MSNKVTSDARAIALARCFDYLYSLGYHLNKNEPAADNLGGDAAAGSEASISNRSSNRKQ